jgi:hypothetical protein
LNQIALTRAQRGATGNVYFSMRSFMFGRDNLPEKLVAGPYASKALIPASTWLDSIPPLSPVVRVGRDTATGATLMTLEPQGAEATWLWLIRARVGTGWTTETFPGYLRFLRIPRIPGAVPADEIAVSAVDRSSNESAPTLLALPPS